jgi:hypothetical protein
MELRFTSSRCNSAKFCNLFVLVTLDIMQNENLSRSRRQRINRLRQVHPVGIARRCRRTRESLFADLVLVVLYSFSCTPFVLPIG